MSTLDMRNFTRRKAPSISYSTIANAVLPGWDISLVFAGEKRAQHLNATLRGKTYIPNVLSYELGKRSGEIVICLPIAKKQAASYGLTYREAVAFFFIHALLHLKGVPHGTTMERYENEYLRRFLRARVKYGNSQNRYGD